MLIIDGHNLITRQLSRRIGEIRVFKAFNP
nr:MAG TPA: YacP-like NYN domain protein [Caudoviricetes sp.]